MRSFGHLAERPPGNIGGASGRGAADAHFVDMLGGYAFLASSATSRGNLWSDEPGESAALLSGVGRDREAAALASVTGVAQAPSTPPPTHSDAVPRGTSPRGSPRHDPPSPSSSGADVDAASSDGTCQVDVLDMPVHYANEQKAECV